MTVQGMSIGDFGNVLRALQGLPPLATASLSFNIEWTGVIKRLNVSNAALPTPFTGEFVHNTAVMSWRATEGASTIVGLAKASGFAEIGHERNGAFFSED